MVLLLKPRRLTSSSTETSILDSKKLPFVLLPVTQRPLFDVGGLAAGPNLLPNGNASSKPPCEHGELKRHTVTN